MTEKSLGITGLVRSSDIEAFIAKPFINTSLPVREKDNECDRYHCPDPSRIPGLLRPCRRSAVRMMKHRQKGEEVFTSVSLPPNYV